MKFNVIIASVFFLLIQAVISKGQDSMKYCGTDAVMNSVFQNNPKAVFIHQQLEQFTQQFQQNSNSRQLYIIPVVFHIIHNYGYENISDWQVKDAMRILNEDFNKQNADTSSIVTLFKPIAANCGIEFRLATIAPDGNCTNGIEHIASSTTYAGGEHSKLNPWPSDMYLNIWVVKEIASGAAGYTYYPGNADFDKDGIILLSNYVGSIGTGTYQRSRALTHEIGHWINLKHTWGSTNSPGVACGSDNVADTPETEGWTSCNLNGAVCNAGTIENVQNYMEYAYCSRMFTNGQKARMIAALNSSTGSRNNLWSNSNLTATGTNNASSSVACIPVADFISNTKFVCAGDPVTFTDLSWNSTVLYRFWDLQGSSSASSLTDSVITVTYNLPGIYTVSLHAGNNTGSNTKTQIELIQVLADSANYQNGYIESFESGSLISTNYFPDNSADIEWYIKTNAGYTGTNCLSLNNFSATPGITYSVIGPTLNLKTITNPILTFHVAYAQRTTDNMDRLRVFVSENCGKTWIPRYGKSGAQLATAPLHANNFVPDATEWRMETVSLVANAISQNLRIKFDLVADGGNNIYIDDINLGGFSLIENIDPINLFQLYPNPVADEIKFQFNSDNVFSGSIKLYDLTGRLLENIYSGKLNPESILTYNVSHLTPQIYIIQITTAAQTQMLRFIKTGS